MAHSRGTDGASDKLPPVGEHSLTATPTRTSYQHLARTPRPPPPNLSKDQFTSTYVGTWKVTDKNLNERVKEVNDIANWLLSKDTKEIFQNPGDYKGAIILTIAGLYNSRNPQKERKLAIFQVLLNLGYHDLLHSYWACFVENFEAARSSFDKGLTEGQLWVKFLSDPQFSYIQGAMVNFGDAIIYSWNGTDLSDHKTGTEMYNALIQLVLDILDSKYLLEILPKTAESNPLFRLAKGMLGTLHNFLQKLDDLIPDMRERGALKVVSQYKNLTVNGRSNLQLRSRAVLAASYLITEDDDQNTLMLNKTDFVFLGQSLKNCLSGANYHSKDGYDAEEMLSGLNNVAVVESNKKKLVDANILPLLVESMRATRHTIQADAAQTVWTISFDEESRKHVQSTPGMMSELKTLSQSSKSSVQKAARGALWQIEGETAHFNAVTSKTDNARTHIMISYQWDVKPQVLKIRERLRQAGFRVWIDVEQMSGSTLEAMAHAVQHCACFVPVLTEKYKASPACRLEAENAHLQQKKIVPIRLQPKYIPDGWLGFMLGSTFFYDLTKPNEYESKVQDFLKALGNVAKILPGEEAAPVVFQSTDVVGSSVVDGASASIQSAPVGPLVSSSWPSNVDPSRLKCANWSKTDVSNWLKKNSLERFCDVSPEIYYSVLREDYKKSLKDMLYLTSHLRKLASE